MSFWWNGKNGQPSWVWGGDDGTTMYVYNPSNFSVNYANFAVHDSQGRDIHQDFQSLIYGENASGGEQQVYGGSKAKMWTDNEGGNLRLTSPNGNAFAEFDLYSNDGLRVYTVNDGSKGIFIGTDGNLTLIDGDILFNGSKCRLGHDGNLYMNCGGYTDWLTDILNAKASSSHTHDDRYITSLDNGYIHVNKINKFSDSDNILFGCSNGRNYIVAVTIWSDEKIKKNIEDSQVCALDKLNAIKMHEFDFTDEAYGSHTECGYVAQELKKIIPEAVVEVPQSKEITGYDSLCQVNDTKLIPYLVKAIQELSIRITKLEK